jgi:molybdopterin-guanine dinucleotide biosynthesis protein A
MQRRHEQSADTRIWHDSVVSSTPAAAILAGGAARRFGGRDKCRLVVEGRAIIVRQIDVLAAIARPVFVVGGDPARFADLGLQVHGDLIPGAGAIGGIYTALEVSPADRVIVVACDLPFLTPPLLRRLVELAEPRDGAWIHGPRGVEPLVAVYQRAAAPAIRQAIDAGRFKAAGLGQILAMAELPIEAVAEFGPPERLLANVNTPDEYARIQ